MFKFRARRAEERRRLALDMALGVARPDRIVATAREFEAYLKVGHVPPAVADPTAPKVGF